MAKKEISSEQKALFIIENNLEYLKSVLFEKLTAPVDYFNYNKFIRCFKDSVSNNIEWHEYLKSMITAFSEVTPQRSDDIIRWVEKTTSSEIFALEINKAFPESKFIHVVRDPRDNFSSLKSGWETKYRYLSDSSTIEALRQSCIERGRLGMEMGKMNQALLGKDKYMMLRYEDLVLNTSQSLIEVAHFLHIDHQRIDNNPTICGLPWNGNNMEGIAFKGISTTQVGLWKERIDQHEAALMEFHFGYLMKHYGYTMEFSKADQATAANKHYEWINFYKKD